MSGLSFLAVFGGAGVGALLRWWLALWLNPLWAAIPLGTVAANLGGGLLIGIAMATFEDTALAPEWRLLIITGFLGGLTTFSTFSGEVVTLLMRQQYGWAVSAAGLHLLGSIALTGVGIALANAVWLRG
jgi:CrcB protein